MQFRTGKRSACEASGFSLAPMSTWGPLIGHHLSAAEHCSDWCLQTMKIDEEVRRNSMQHAAESSVTITQCKPQFIRQVVYSIVDNSPNSRNRFPGNKLNFLSVQVLHCKPHFLRQMVYSPVDDSSNYNWIFQVCKCYNDTHYKRQIYPV